MSRVGNGRMHFRYIGWAVFWVFKIRISILDYFSFFFGGGGGGSENLGMKVFVDIFGVTSKIEFFICFILLNSTTGICVL